MRPAETGPAPARPRIAVVAASPAILGGQGVQAQALLENLRRDGYRVDFVPIDAPFPRGLRWLRRLRFVRTVLNQLLYLPSLLALRRADVVHAFSASYWSFLLAPAPAIAAGRAFGKRVVLHYHSGEAADHLARWGATLHPWLRAADRIVVPSEYLRTVFERFGHRTRVINNVVDVERFAFRERLPLRPRLLSMRNLEPHYRVDVVLRAFALLKATVPEATLTIAGVGGEAQRLRRLAAELALDDVHFIGRVEPATAPEVYAQADVFVNAAVVDNQPVSVIEACAAGLPVVSTATGDIGAMLGQGEFGVLVPPDDPAAMAEAVAALLAVPERAAAMARRARAAAERYTWPRVRADWEEVYRC